jgi:cyanophycinase
MQLLLSSLTVDSYLLSADRRQAPPSADTARGGADDPPVPFLPRVTSQTGCEVVIRSRSHTGVDPILGRLAEQLPGRWTWAGAAQTGATSRVEPVGDSAVAQRAGQLVVVGGAEDHLGRAVILRRFRDLCGGKRARIAVLGTATTIPTEVGDGYLTAFRALGVKEVVFLPLASRAAANAAKTIAILDRVDGVFFTGGAQLRIAAVVGGSRVDAWLHQKLQRGLVIAGTSAGAAMMSSTMILGDCDTMPGDVMPGGTTPGTSIVSLGPGLGFLPGVVIDMHMTERRRLTRLLAAVARLPHHLGIGIDEDTALIVDGNRFEVIGSGTVTVIDAGGATSMSGPNGERPIALTGMLIHVLTTGYAFNLTTRLVERTAGPEAARRLSRAS